MTKCTCMNDPGCGDSTTIIKVVVPCDRDETSWRNGYILRDYVALFHFKCKILSILLHDMKGVMNINQQIPLLFLSFIILYH